MCLHDLQKAFDSLEYAVLMDKLFQVVVKGKIRHLLGNWYKGRPSWVREDGRLFGCYAVSRRLKQGSVLSPALFYWYWIGLGELCQHNFGHNMCMHHRSIFQHNTPLASIIMQLAESTVFSLHLHLSDIQLVQKARSSLCTGADPEILGG